MGGGRDGGGGWGEGGEGECGWEGEFCWVGGGFFGLGLTVWGLGLMVFAVGRASGMVVVLMLTCDFGGIVLQNLRHVHGRPWGRDTRFHGCVGGRAEEDGEEWLGRVQDERDGKSSGGFEGGDARREIMGFECTGEWRWGKDEGYMNSFPLTLVAPKAILSSHNVFHSCPVTAIFLLHRLRHSPHKLSNLSSPVPSRSEYFLPIPTIPSHGSKSPYPYPIGERTAAVLHS